VDQPPADPNAANNTPVPPKPDNDLLLFGGLALFAAIAWPKSKIMGSGGPSSKWLLPGVVLGAAGLLWYYHNKATGQNAVTRQDQTNYLSNWVNASTTDPEAAKQYFLAQLQAMTDAEVSDVYDYIAKYQGDATKTPADLEARITAISAKYQIFT
jgi:hypothetical protein